MTMTYTRCGLCNGKLHLLLGTTPTDRGYPEDCPCTRSSTPGWSPTGVTEKQLERLVKSGATLQELLTESLLDANEHLRQLRNAYREKRAPIIPTAEMGEAR